MKENMLQYLKPITAIAIISFMAWYFSDLVAYILVATFLSLLGAPMVKRLNKIKIGTHNLPRSVCALLSVVGMLLVFV